MTERTQKREAGDGCKNSGARRFSTVVGYVEVVLPLHVMHGHNFSQGPSIRIRTVLPVVNCLGPLCMKWKRYDHAME
jgi:hypothetical protein